jgi:dihydrolipoamide dehydrogenase
LSAALPAFDTLRAAGPLLVVGGGPGAAEVARMAAAMGVPVATGVAVRGGGPGLCVLAPRARPLLPAWWPASQAPSAGSDGRAPEAVVVVGGGHSGVEAALHWVMRAPRVMLVEAGDSILPGWDDQVAAHVASALAARGVTVLCRCRAVALAARGEGVEIRLRARGAAGDRCETADVAVPALGLRPDVAGVGLERTRALADRLGFLQVDSRLETAEPGLYALGAALALPLTPAALARQAVVMASCAAGRPTAPVRFHLLPRVIAVAGDAAALTAGLTAAGARERGFRVACGQAGDARAWVACVRDADTGAVLGVHAAGEGADALADAATALLEGIPDPSGREQDGRSEAEPLMHNRLVAAFVSATKETGPDA